MMIVNLRMRKVRNKKSCASTLRDFDKLSSTIMERLTANMIVNDSE